jgi:hypothetical protein
MTEITKKPENKGCLYGCGSLILIFAVLGLISSIITLQEQNITPEQKAQREKERVDEWFSSTSSIGAKTT